MPLDQATSQKKMTSDSHPATLAAQAMGHEDPETGALVKPIHVSTTFARNEQYVLPADRSYIRDHGPAQSDAEEIIRALERGSDALLFSSGLAACTAPFHALEMGDHVVVSRVVYHGVLTWLNVFAKARGISYTLFETGDIAAFKTAIIPGKTRLAWLETPANPTWAVIDIAAFSHIAHQYDVTVAVDSTCATPVLTQPLVNGADIVCHSGTKYLNGHSDVLAGALVTVNETPYWERIRQHRLLAGATLGSIDAFLLTRGMRTLFVRVERQCANALAVAKFLDNHSHVERVHYPGLATDPGHEIASRQMRGGYGGMLSFLVPGGREQAIEVVCRAQILKRATSLGGVESVLEHRKTSENDTTDTPENLIRVSIGIEHVDDLIEDFQQMLS